MSKYGYIGAVPTQANGSNSGVFSITEVNKLINAGQWSTLIDLDNMNLLYEYIFTGSESSITILSSDVDSSVHKNLYMVGDLSGTSMTEMTMQFSDDDFSTTYTGNHNGGTAIAYGTGAYTRTTMTQNTTGIEKLTPASLTGDMMMSYTISNLYDDIWEGGITGVTTGYNGSNSFASYTYGRISKTSSSFLNSFKFNISNVDAGSTLKFYGYVSS